MKMPPSASNFTTANAAAAARPTTDPAQAALAVRSGLLANTRAVLVLVCVGAFVLRVAAIFALRAWDHPGAMEHDAIARFIVAGQGFTFSDWGVVQPTSVQSPLFPGVLALAFLAFGSGTAPAYTAVMILNAALGAIGCAVTYAMTRAVGGTRRVAILAAVLVAVWPTQVYAATFAQAIAFITTATCAVVWLWYRSVETSRLRFWIAYALLGCLAALTEPVLLPFMALSGSLILGWRGLALATRVQFATLLFLAAMLILAPWAYRNYRIHDALVPVKSTFWVNVWKGNNANASGTDRLRLTDAQREAALHLSDEELRSSDIDARRQYDELTPEQKMELWEKSEVEREKVFATYAKDFIREHPERYLQLCGIRFWKTVWVEADNPKSHGVMQYVAYWIPRTLLLLATPVGFVLAWQRRWRMLVPVLIVGIALITYTLTITAARFALPYEPMQLALMALGLSAFYDRLTGRSREAA